MAGWGFEPIKEWPAVGFQKMQVMGFGCLLIKTDVLRKIGHPYFFRCPKKNGSMAGHDEVFCARVYDAGYEVFADCLLSREVGHIGAKEYKLGPQPPWPHFEI